MTEHELMLTTILGCDKSSLYKNKKNLDPFQLERFNQMRKRRASGEPLQYILGQANFMGIDLIVDKRVLIPRPETEILVDLAINKIKKNFYTKKIKVLDIGTGSGNIAVAFAKNIQDCSVTSIDISNDALEVARINAKNNYVDNKIRFIQSDLEKFFDKNNEKFDLIISNPPYIETNNILNLPDDVKQEPHAALDGGIDGLDFYRIIIKQAHKLLNESGILICEIGDDQKQGIIDIFENNPFYKELGFEKDYVGTFRIFFAVKKE